MRACSKRNEARLDKLMNLKVFSNLAVFMGDSENRSLVRTSSQPAGDISVRYTRKVPTIDAESIRSLRHSKENCRAEPRSFPGKTPFLCVS